MSNIIVASTKAILSRYLAPDIAETAAAEVGSNCADILQQTLAQALGSALAAAALPKVEAALAAAPAPVASRSRKAAPKAAKASKVGGARTLTEASHETMRFKKKLYWAQKRAAAKPPMPPLPGDAEVIAAAKADKMINIDKWTGKAKPARPAKVAEPVKAAKAVEAKLTKTKPAKAKAASAAPAVVPPPSKAVKAVNGAHAPKAVASLVSADAPF